MRHKSQFYLLHNSIKWDCLIKARRREKLLGTFFWQRFDPGHQLPRVGREDCALVCPGPGPVRASDPQCLKQFTSFAAPMPTPAFYCGHSHVPAPAARGCKASGCFPTRPLRSHLLGSSLWPFAPEGECSLTFTRCLGPARHWSRAGSPQPGLACPALRKRIGRLSSVARSPTYLRTGLQELPRHTAFTNS